ncbi:MAG: FHA domain-containing protein, partial [Solirubrobacteraceae bacterium]
MRAAHQVRSGLELEQIIEAERLGVPFLLWRDADQVQRMFMLEGQESATLGRRSSNDVVLSGDDEVSRTHAQLELIGEDWMITDVGPSHNGTYVNGVR